MARQSSDPTALLEIEHAVVRGLCETPRADDVYPTVLAAIGQVLGWELGAAWEVPRQRGARMHCVASWRAPGSAARDFESITRSARFSSGEGLPGRVWATGEPAWIVDVVADDNYPRADAARKAGLHAALCFPTRGARGVVGGIEFYARELRDPDAPLLATMASLGRQIGQFVERRRAEEAMEASEQRLRAMLESALDCVVVIDHNGRILDLNHAAELTFGYAATQVIGREMADVIVPPHLRDAHRRGLARVVAGGEARVLDRRIEITGMRADGSEFPVELTITRIAMPGPPTFTGYIRDITDRKRAEEELRASRSRIVDASDAERRRLERDLHDGAQQRLVTLGLSLRLAKLKLASDPSYAAALVEEAIDDLQQATAELRELARGIHPAVLTDGGLEPALAVLADRGTLPITVAVPSERLPAAVEAAAYFVVAEALTNVARYAQARRAEVTVTRANGNLHVEVSDDGRGGADAAAGTGLTGLGDRVAALGGELSVSSPPGEGTVVTAEIPCE
ncbi:MAG TPA: PAS domain S-box protein [Thermoleophilaceae bacterium]|nr:PAS domain S-box protein [Thermoleophilaceae bacterium]